MIGAAVTLWLVALSAVIALAFAGAALHRAMLLRERRRFPPPGELFDVGGFRVHLHRTGEGIPTVILDSALAGTSLSWSEVVPALAESTSVVRYDRAGFGWSDATGLPRRVDRLVEELRRALAAARIDPPYVLVGHSYGGWISRLFASSYPDEVAGLVLVDVPHPREWKEPSEEQLRRIRRGARLARVAAVLAPVGVTRLLFRLAARARVLGGRASPESARISSLLGKVPEPMRPVLRSFWVRAGTLTSLASLVENAPESASLVEAAPPSLDDRPLVVLTAANPSSERVRDQEELVRSTARGRHVVAGRSGHWIPLEEPQLVVEAVREVVAAAREAQGVPSGFESRFFHDAHRKKTGRRASRRNHSE